MADTPAAGPGPPSFGFCLVCAAAPALPFVVVLPAMTLLWWFPLWVAAFYLPLPLPGTFRPSFGVALFATYRALGQGVDGGVPADGAGCGSWTLFDWERPCASWAGTLTGNFLFLRASLFLFFKMESYGELYARLYITRSFPQTGPCCSRRCASSSRC